MKTKRMRLMPILMAIMMAFTMMPMIGGAAYASSEVTVDGIKYTLHDDNTATVSGHTDEHPADVVFPEKVEGYTVTGIGDYVFDRYKGNLTSISIPKTVTSIGMYAFDDTGLTSVSIGENSELASIGIGAFDGCRNLTSITIPKKVKVIEVSAFKNSGLKTIIFEDGSELIEIGTYAFENCSSLTSITIPSSVTSIGSEVFSGCNALETVYYSGTEKQWNAMPDKDSDWAKNWNGSVVCLGTVDPVYTVTYEVVNGTWSDGKTDPIEEEVVVGDNVYCFLASINRQCISFSLASDPLWNHSRMQEVCGRE